MSKWSDIKGIDIYRSPEPPPNLELLSIWQDTDDNTFYI